jgi:hypothetical protein
VEDWNGDSRAPPDVRNLVIRKAVPCTQTARARAESSPLLYLPANLASRSRIRNRCEPNSTYRRLRKIVTRQQALRLGAQELASGGVHAARDPPYCRLGDMVAGAGSARRGPGGIPRLGSPWPAAAPGRGSPGCPRAARPVRIGPLSGDQTEADDEIDQAEGRGWPGRRHRVTRHADFWHPTRSTAGTPIRAASRCANPPLS